MTAAKRIGMSTSISNHVFLTVSTISLLAGCRRYVFMHRGGAIASSDLRTLEENNDNKELIAYVKTPYQKAHIFWTEVSGLHLFLDGTTQTVESDERIYHESLVHSAMLAHPLPRNVLILGGGEGAVLREVLAHTSVEHV